MDINTSPNRVAVVEANLDRYLAEASAVSSCLEPNAPLSPGSGLTAQRALELFEDQYTSRVLDVVARELKRDKKSFYTISSAGHEQNAVLGALLRTDDPCFLHYRSGALMMARARRASQRPRDKRYAGRHVLRSDPRGKSPAFNTLLGLCAAADDPASGGRHKVWGSGPMWVPPQTSTIASHLPKAVGAAFALSRAKRMGVELPLSGDAIFLCSFGDASSSHATALAGINSARYAFRGGRPTPLVFLCEDNRIGISVDTPSGWIENRFGTMPSLAYFHAKGPVDEIWDTTRAAIDHCRTTRGPVFLHMDTVRLFGHAGSDVETTYRSWEEINKIEAQDPLLANARRLVETGAATPAELAALVTHTRERIRAAAREASTRPKLTCRTAVMAPLAPYDEEATRREVERPIDATSRLEVLEGNLPEDTQSPTRQTLAAHLNAALADELLRRPEVILFGEDVGKKGGVYGLTAKLQRRFGRARIFDTLLDETTILGVAQGAAHIGLLPIPEIQYLAYIHNAVDQLRSEASSLRFFSNGTYTNPMVVRVAAFAYQRGFGGHFHNDNSIGGLRDIPGLVLCTPARGDDAARLLRGVVAHAKANGTVVCFLEPIALYHERDLYADGDGGWLSDYPALTGDAARDAILPGEVGLYGPEATDLLIVSYANGLRFSLRAAKRLKDAHGIEARVLDLRWLSPLPFAALEEHAAACDAVLVADEARATGGGIADAVVAHLAKQGMAQRIDAVTSADSFIPLGPAADLVLLSEDEIFDAALALATRDR
jgi:2-oxoisovalerate dehydrogenase E1 component